MTKSELEKPASQPARGEKQMPQTHRQEQKHHLMGDLLTNANDVSITSLTKSHKEFVQLNNRIDDSRTNVPAKTRSASQGRGKEPAGEELDQRDRQALKRLYGRNRAYQHAKAQNMQVKEMRDRLEQQKKSNMEKIQQHEAKSWQR